MHSFWKIKNFWKGVHSNHLIWTGPQSCPKISQYPDYFQYYKKQTHLRFISDFKRNVSLFPPFKGSITVETAFALPLFLFFCIQIISIIGFFHLHSVLEAALHQEVAQAALRAYAYEKLNMDTESSACSLLEDVYIKNKVIQRAGEQYLDHSMIAGGSRGIHIIFKEKEEIQDTVDVILFYRVEPMVDLLGFSGFTMANRCRMKAWTGYRVENIELSEDESEELVYIAETGSVYHKRRNCSHLSLSVREVQTKSLDVLRNEGGGKYSPCENCGKKAGSTVYVTDQGNRYHTFLSCSGLKRTVYRVPLSEAGGRGACSRCCAVG